MSAADSQPRTKFGDVEFPGSAHDADGSYRHHVHEYPHSPGGAPEKLGRALYKVTIKGEFHATLAGYPGLYPEGMNTLRGYFEQGATLPLTHPSLGTFPAFIIGWKQVKSARIRSGEVVDITFLEDQAASFALASITGRNYAETLATTGRQLEDTLSLIQEDMALSLSDNDLSIFDALQVGVNDILALRDTADLYGNRYAAAVDNVINLCSQIDGLQSCQDARAWPLMDIQRELWANAIQVQNDLLAQRIQLSTWIVPSSMTATQIALTLYADASRTSDILTLNANVISDPMLVEGGTEIRYYPAQAKAS